MEDKIIVKTNNHPQHQHQQYYQNSHYLDVGKERLPSPQQVTDMYVVAVNICLGMSAAKLSRLSPSLDLGVLNY